MFLNNFSQQQYGEVCLYVYECVSVRVCVCVCGGGTDKLND